MTAARFGSPTYFAVLGILCGVVGFRIGWRLRLAAVLPIVQALFGYFAFLLAWTAGGPWWAAGAAGGWAVGATVTAIPTILGDRERADRSILRAREYRREMLRWLRTGSGPESRPLATAGAHALELSIYLAAAAASANVLGLVLGAVLLNYMNAYVAALLRGARRRFLVSLVAWNPWSVVRVAAYVLLGAACAAPLLGRMGFPAGREQVLLLLAWGGAGVVADLLLKLALSRAWGRMLASAVDVDAAGST